MPIGGGNTFYGSYPRHISIHFVLLRIRCIFEDGAIRNMGRGVCREFIEMVCVWRIQLGTGAGTAESSGGAGQSELVGSDHSTAASGLFPFITK